MATSKKNYYNIIVVHSYPESSPWTKGITLGLTNTFSYSGYKVKIKNIIFYAEGLKRSGKDSLIRETNHVIDEISNSKDLDAIVVSDDEAADIIIPRIDSTKYPIFFTGINRDKSSIKWLQNITRKNICGVFEHYPIESALQILKKMKPNVVHMSILSSQSPSSLITSDQISKEMKNPEFEKKTGIKLGSINLLRKFSEWKRMVIELKNQNDALWILVPYEVLDENNQEVNPSIIGKYMRDNITVPTMGIISIHTRIGFLAAVSVGGESLGKQTGEQILRYFSGETPEEIGYERVKYHTLEINSSEAKRLNLSIPNDLMGFASFIKD